MEIQSAEDSFETFFNNEALSDRVLIITEVAKVFPVSATPPNSHSLSGSKRPFPQNCDSNVVNVDCSSNKRVSLQKDKISQQEDNNDNASVEMASPDDEASQLNDEIEQLHVIEDQSTGEDCVRIMDDEQDQPSTEQQEDTIVPRGLVNQIKSDEHDYATPQDLTGDQPSRSKSNSEGEQPCHSKSNSDGEQARESSLNADVCIVVPKVEFERDLPSCSNVAGPSSSQLNDVVKEERSVTSVKSCMRSKTTPLVGETKVLKETRVFVHSVILAAKSEFFKCLFATSGMRETKEKEVRLEIQSNETKSMLILLHCFYYKNFINSQDLQTVLDVCGLAMQYCYDGLIEKCLDIFRCRAENVTDVHDINQIAHMVSKIQNELQQHKEKCTRVMKTCGPFLMNSFYPIDELLEKAPEKFYQLHLNSMYLLLDRSVQERFNQDNGNLYVYAMQKWLRAHLPSILSNEKYKSDVIKFIEKLLNVVELHYITGAFLSNVMAYQHSPLALWDGYKDWYIRALQTMIFEYSSNKRSDGQQDQQYPVMKRRRLSKFVRKEKNADIFSLTSPIVLNGFEIGVYLRIREDRKIHLICKCKNLVINKSGFDQCNLQFRLRGTIKINIEQNIWFEQFPQAHSHWVNDWFGFSYKQGGMCLQMYSVCRLPESVYDLAKQYGFSLAMQLQQIK